MLDFTTAKQLWERRRKNALRCLLAMMAVWVASSVQAGSLHLRVGPGFEYPMVVELPQNTALNPIERKQNWLKVEAESYKGWIHVDELLKNISFNRPHPEQFKYQRRKDTLGLEIGITTEKTLSLGGSIPMYGHALGARIDKTVGNDHQWFAFEVGGIMDLYSKKKLNLNMFMGLGLGVGAAGSYRWSDSGESTQVPLFSLSTDAEWKFEENAILALRAQIRNALAGNSKYHGALALVWKIRL